MNLIPTLHFRHKLKDSGFTIDQVIEAFSNPRAVTKVRSRPEFEEKNQKRVCGAGVAVVVEPCKDGWLLRTVYADQVLTPMREDQKDDGYAIRSRRLSRTGSN